MVISSLHNICTIVQIRLVDGTVKIQNDTTRDGRVEVLSNGEWGTICDVGFDVQDADVILLIHNVFICFSNKCSYI